MVNKSKGLAKELTACYALKLGLRAGERGRLAAVTEATSRSSFSWISDSVDGIYFRLACDLQLRSCLASAVSIYLWYSNRAKVKCPLFPSRHNQGHLENDRMQATHIVCVTQLVIDSLTLWRLGDFWGPSQNVLYIRSPFYQK